MATSDKSAKNLTSPPQTDVLSSLDARLAAIERRLEAWEPIVETLAPVRDEIKSLADVASGISKELFWIKAFADKASLEAEAAKTESRLVRSDLGVLSKRLSAKPKRASSAT